MFWIIAVFVASLVLAFAFAPKIKTSSAPTSEVQAPTAEVGREIGVLFGTRDLNGPNVTWYGAVRVVPIKKKGGKK